MQSVALCWAVLACTPLVFAQTPSLSGRWNWGAGGGIVEIEPGGGGRDPRGNSLQWTLRDAGARAYVVRWSHGYTDTVTLAADGNSLTAVNNQGMRFTATRVSGATALPVGSSNVIAGKWNWGAGGGIVEIEPGGTGRDPRGNTLSWTVRDAATRTYTAKWSHGYTDTLTLAPDGNSLTGVNNQGLRFTATRVSGGGGRDVSTAPLDLNGSWTGGILHIWQDGQQVLATATWKRDDGKYVIWRGEGRLNDHTVELAIRYSPMAHGPVPEWRGVFTVSPDGNRIDAVYTLGAQRDLRSYVRER
ncbi:hypothetical protein [Paludibaculum fermentans]|uniref:hypothetical protein n=1 Tax=Paludibaculum fermentans TaxID=1473598 RepID=UPI003EBA57AD